MASTTATRQQQQQPELKLFDPDMRIPDKIRVPKLQTNLLINNRWVHPRVDKTFATINPATGETICQVSEAHAEDVDLAVHAAKNAFPAWSTTPGAPTPQRQSAMLELVPVLTPRLC
jgi:aldehyde dehydrogenase (NAD+)